MHLSSAILLALCLGAAYPALAGELPADLKGPVTEADFSTTQVWKEKPKARALFGDVRVRVSGGNPGAEKIAEHLTNSLGNFEIQDLMSWFVPGQAQTSLVFGVVCKPGDCKAVVLEDGGVPAEKLEPLQLQLQSTLNSVAQNLVARVPLRFEKKGS